MPPGHQVLFNDTLRHNVEYVTSGEILVDGSQVDGSNIDGSNLINGFS